MLKSKNPLTELKGKLMKTEDNSLLQRKTNVYAKRQNYYWVNKENPRWKEDNITPPQEPQLEKYRGRKMSRKKTERKSQSQRNIIETN